MNMQLPVSPESKSDGPANNDTVPITNKPITNKPITRSRRRQQLNAEVGSLMANLLGCLIIGWACFNVVANIRALKGSEADFTSVCTAVVVLIIFCAGPFSLGVWLLFQKPKSK